MSGPRQDLPFVLALLVTAGVAVLVGHMPYADVVNHLARYALMDQYWFGTRPDYIAVHLIPSGYIGVDLLGVAVYHLTSPETTLRVMGLLGLVALPAGMYALVRAVCPGQRIGTLVAVLLAFNWYYLYGFLNYTIGVGLGLLWLALWWPRRGRWTAATALLASLGMAVLYVTHMAAAATVLVVICLNSLVGTWTALRSRGAGPWTALREGHPLVPVVAIATCAVLLAVNSGAGGAVPRNPGYGVWEFRTLYEKVEHFGTPFYSLSAAQAAVMMVGYAAAVAGYLWGNLRSRARVNPVFALATLALTVVYLVFPVRFLGAYDVDVRFLLPMYLLVFLSFEGRPAGPWARVWMVPWAACVLHAAVIFALAQPIDRDLDHFSRILARVPAGEPVVALVVDPGYGRIDPYRHFVLWQTVRNGGRANALFSFRDAGAHLNHFVVTKPIYAPDEFWAVHYYEPTLRWSEIAADYAYLIEAGTNVRARAEIAQHATPMVSDGEVTLWKVRRDGAGG